MSWKGGAKMFRAGGFDTVVVGGGPSGIMAAISAKRIGRSVAILEKMPQAGKKILASGGGRCNLLNEKINSAFYNPAGRRISDSVFAAFGKEDIIDFFKGLGLMLYSEAGRVFPVTNQSSSVLKALEIEVKRLGIPLELNCEVTDIFSKGGEFGVSAKNGRKFWCGKLVIAGGGMAYPALGAAGSCYRFAEKFRHTIVKPVPSTVPVAAKDEMCHFLQGQKITASARSIAGGRIKSESSGDVIFTKYGLSGTAILDISEELSIELNRRLAKDVFVSVDMVPFMTAGQLEGEIAARIKKGVPPEEALTGILPNKFGRVYRDIICGGNYGRAAAELKDKRFRIIGTRGWNEAEFTAGGVDVGEINESTLESRLKKGLYFAGEILDVNGKRGGYNLAWAWASGYVAGLGGRPL